MKYLKLLIDKKLKLVEFNFHNSDKHYRMLFGKLPSCEINFLQKISLQNYPDYLIQNHKLIMLIILKNYGKLIEMHHKL